MSSPWKFFGTWFPVIESTIPAASTGDGTVYPINWDRTDGATTDDQICKFEWTSKTVTCDVSGAMTATYRDPMGIAPDETVTTPFTISNVSTPVSGTTWDVLEPTDLSPGSSRGFGDNATYTFPVATSWGGDYLSVNLVWGVNMGTSSDILAVDGSGFTQYTKPIQVLVDVTAVNPGSPGAVQNAGTTPPAFSGGVIGAATIFHGSCSIFSTTFVGSSLFPLDITLSVTDTFTQPPNI